MAEVFISYSRKDKEFARQLGDALVARERNAWADWKDIPLTSEWQGEILRNIESADNFIFIISPDSVASVNCRKEIDHAALNHKKMLPLYYRAVPDDAVPETLARFQRLNFDSSEVFDDGVEALIIALDTDLGWTQEHTRLLTRAKEWERLGSDPSFLLRGKDLREAEQWMAKSSDRELKPTALQSQYILASRQSAIRTQRIVIGAVAAAFVVAVGLAIYAFLQRNVAQQETRVATANEAEAALQKKTAETNAEKADANALKADANALEATSQKNIAVKNEAEAVRQRGIAETETDKAILEAKITNARRLATEALYRFGYDASALAVSGGLALESLQAYPTAEGMKALSQVLRLIPPSPTTFSPPAQGKIEAIVFSRDGRLMASGGDHVAVWDVATQTKRPALEAPNSMPLRPPVRALAFSYDGRWLAAGSNGAVAIWDVETGKLATYLRHDYVVRSIAFSPDGEHLATTTFGEGANRGVRFFRKSSQEWEEVRPFPLGTGWSVSVQFLKNGSLAVADKSGVWITHPDPLGGVRYKFGDAGDCYALSVSNDDSLLAALCEKGIITTRIDTEEYAFGDAIPVANHNNSMSEFKMSASRSGNLIAVDDLIYSVSPASERLLLAEGSLCCTSVAFRPDGKSVAASLNDGSILLWPTGQGNQSLLVAGAATTVRGLSISPDESLLASVAEPGVITLFDISPTGRMRRLRQAAIGPNLRAVAFSPDGHLLAVSAKDHLYFVDPRSLKVITETSAHGELSLAFSADGCFLLVRDDLNLRVFTTETRKQTFIMKGRFNELRMSPDGKYLAARAQFNPRGMHHTVEQQSVLRLSDGYQVAWSETGREEADGPGEQPAQSGSQSLIRDSLAWPSSVDLRTTSPDGTWRVDFSVWSSTAILQEVATKRQIASFEHDADLTDAAFSPRGRWLATSSKDGSIRLWPLQVGDLVTQACKLLPRNLTPEEWKDLKMDGPYHKACANRP